MYYANTAKKKVVLKHWKCNHRFEQNKCVVLNIKLWLKNKQQTHNHKQNELLL